MSKQQVSKSERNNKLTTAADYDVNRMMFSEPIIGSVKDTPINYRRINISTYNKDGTIGDLILPTERIFSFGVSENINPETKKTNGHVLPLCLWNKDGATVAEKAWTDSFDRIVEHCKKHLIDNREEIEQYDLSANDLKKFNPLYWKKDKGKVVDGTGPTLYAKLIASKKHNKILSMFLNLDDEPIEPLSLLGKYCYTRAAVKIESIFIGNKISLQVKLYEAYIELIDSGIKPLLTRPKCKQKMLTGCSTNMDEMKEEGGDEDEITKTKPDTADENKGGGSLSNSDVEDGGEVPKEKEKSSSKPVRRIKKVSKK